MNSEQKGIRNMKLHTNYFLMGICLAALSGPLSVRATTVWNGPLTAYTQPAPDPTQPANQDQLTSHVSLTRGIPVGGGTGGMFNGVTETSFSKFLSPADTEWAV